MKIRITFTNGTKFDAVINFIHLAYEDEVPVLIIYPKGEKPTLIPFDLICQLNFM